MENSDVNNKLEIDPEAKAAFQEIAGLWMEVQPSLMLFLSAVVRDSHARDDIQQEVARTVVERFSNYDRTRPFTPWVLGVARICISKYFRVHQKMPVVLDEGIIGKLAQEVPNLETELEDRKLALKTCLENLRGNARQIIRLRYLDELGMEAVAEKVGLTRNAVRVALHRARNILAGCIQRKLAQDRSP